MSDAQIIVSGAGPVGTCLAIDAAMRGAQIIVLEARAADDPPDAKCNTIAARTMETFRRFGIADRVRAALPVLRALRRQLDETLRQPLETGEVVVARANAHVRYPCRFLLVAAANPCRCGYLADAARACSRAPVCGGDYMGKISGPLMDRFDLRLEVPAVSFMDLELPSGGDTSAQVAARVAAARDVQAARFRNHPQARVNAEASGSLLDQIAAPDEEGRALILKASERLGLTARGYHRILRTARTIADLAGSATVRAPHLAEAISYRLPFVAGG